MKVDQLAGVMETRHVQTGRHATSESSTKVVSTPQGEVPHCPNPSGVEARRSTDPNLSWRRRPTMTEMDPDLLNHE